MFATLRRFASSHTIYALSSGQGKCGVAVIRVSGPHTKAVLGVLTNFKSPPQPRTALLRSIRHPDSKEVLDKGLVLWFPGPTSFTGEDSCEFHVHGGLAVVGAVLGALGAIAGLRMAQPGEFTRRAFYNKKLDLTEVEGLADLLQAETEVQRKQALLQTQGTLSQVYNRWRDRLLKTLAHLEADIDFAETDTLEPDIISSITCTVNELTEEIGTHLRDGRKGELLRSGVRTVILGAPNVGKSSLMNLLCQRPAAIVTPLAGTTRDLLEVTLNINGYPLVLTDTAGLRVNTIDVIEMEGISRAKNSYQHCDLVLLVIDAVDYHKSKLSYDQYIANYLKQLNIGEFTKNCVVVFNKSDLTVDYTPGKNDGRIWISCKTEDGAAALIDGITEQLKNLCGEPSHEHPAMNQARHREQLSKCLHYLHRFHQEYDAVLQAECLRLALRHLGYLVGSVTTEQLLDVIFKDFCIGK